MKPKVEVTGKVNADERLVVLTFMARKFSPVRTIDLKKLGDVTTLPKELQTFLAQRFVPKGTLDDEKRIEQEARAWLDRYALNLGNGLFLLNPANGLEAAEKFEALKGEYEKAAQETVSTYEESKRASEAQLRASFPGYTGMDALVDALHKQIPTKTELEASLRFDYQMMSVGKVDTKFDPAKDPLLSKGFLELHCGMFGRLVADVCRKAQELLKDLTLQKAAADGRIKEKTFKRVRVISEKVSEMSFIDSRRAGDMKRLIDEAIDAFPKAFPWEESLFLPFCELVRRLANQAHVVTCLDKGTPLFTLNTQLSIPAPAAVVAEVDEGEETAIVEEAQPPAPAPEAVQPPVAPKPRSGLAGLIAL